MGDYRVTEFLMKRTSVKQPFHKIIHALLPYITVMTALCFIENVVIFSPETAEVTVLVFAVPVPADCPHPESRTETAVESAAVVRAVL